LYIFGCFVVIFGSTSLWDYSLEQGWRWHDELATVASKPWTSGEYKKCTSLNSKEEKVLMSCDQVSGVEGKVFKVRFYGQTHFQGQAELPEAAWQCRRNGDADPAITCEMAKKEE
jgi:hypothetical protein